MNPVRLFKVRCHLCQKFILRDTNIYSKTKFPPNSIFDLVCCLNRISTTPSHIQETLINTVLLDPIRILS